MMPGVAHADTDDGGVGFIVDAAEEAHEGEVVGEGARGGDKLDEVGVEGLHAVVDRIEVLGGVEVVIAEDDGSAGVAELAHGGFGELLDGLEFKVDELEAGGCGVEEDLEGGGAGAGEAAAVLGEAAGSDGGGGAVVGQKSFEERESGRGFGEVIEAELEESGLFEDVGGAVDHLLRGCAGDGDAEFADAGAEKMGGDLKGCCHACSRGIVPPKWLKSKSFGGLDMRKRETGKGKGGSSCTVRCAIGRVWRWKVAHFGTQRVNSEGRGGKDKSNQSLKLCVNRCN